MLVTHCWTMTSQSSTSICCKPANMVVLVILEQTARPSWFHKCSMGWGQKCWQAIPSSPLWWTLLCGGEHCHLGGQSLVPDSRDMGLPLVAEFQFQCQWQQASFFQWWRCRPTPSQCHPPKYVTLLVQLSPKCSAHFLHTLTPWYKYCRQNLDSSLNITFLHVFRFQCTCCWHQRTWAWQWRADMVGLLSALWDRRMAVCSLFWMVWAESCWTYPANFDCKSAEDCLRLFNANIMRKLSSWGAIFLGCPLHGLSLMYGTWPSVCRWCQGSLQTMLQLGFAQHQLEVALLHRPYPEQSHVACWFLEQTPTDHCSRAHDHRCWQSAAKNQKLKTSE